MTDNSYEPDEQTLAAAPQTEPSGAPGSALEPVAEVVQQRLDAVVNAVEAIAQAVSQLRMDFDTKIKYDESKDRTINALHQELQDYRADIVLKHQRPLVNDLISLYDDLGRMVAAGGTVERLSDIRADIEAILARNGIEAYEMPGDTFDSAFQRVQQVVPTDIAEQDRRVAARVRCGFRYGDRVIRPELVNIFRYTPPTNDPAG
ncbi:MAG: nucleotide exchange factor GrpE [Aggregatilineales bacterium]